jgi:hypothetical protein
MSAQLVSAKQFQSRIEMKLTLKYILEFRSLEKITQITLALFLVNLFTKNDLSDLLSRRRGSCGS